MNFRLVLSVAMATLLVLSAPAAADPLADDTAVQLAGAAGFTAVRAWSVSDDGKSIVVTAPEGDLTFAVIDVGAAAGAREAALAAAAGFASFSGREVEQVTASAAQDGWEERATVSFKTSPAEHSVLVALARRNDDHWVVALVAGSQDTVGKRGAALSTMAGSLRPADFAKEDFSGKDAHPLTGERIAALKDFIRSAMVQLQIPGVGYAFMDKGKLVEEGGLGTRDPKTGVPVDAHTAFLIASNTKGMSTLLLATLVDEGKLEWDQPVVQLMPDFRLGSDAVTKSVLVRQLVCACTGLPRKDMELIFATRPDTPASDTFSQLAATEPTSGFGEVFQYNNLMASAAGYLGGHIAHPGMELGAAYDTAMQERIFGPLKMADTTFDFPTAMAGDFSVGTDIGLYGDLAVLDQKLNLNFYPFRPAGGAWSSAHDVARYVMLELNEGVTPDGKRLVSAENLLKRREPNVPLGEDASYGMGLEVSHEDGVTRVSHGGSLAGYKSDWIALPESGVGAVILTNSESGQLLLGPFARKLVEVLYDGRDVAAGQIAAAAKSMATARATLIGKLTTGQEAIDALGLAPAYRNASLGEIRFEKQDGKTRMFIGPYDSSVELQANEDGTSSLVMTEGFLIGGDLLVGMADGKRTLTMLDAQHVYLYTEE